MAVKLPDLGQMVGPLPLGAWAGVVAGGLGLAYVARRRQGSAEEVEEEPTVPVFPSTPVTSGPTRLNPIPYEPGAPVLTDNTEWLREAVVRLVAKGYAPWKSQQCLAAYLEGVIPTGDPNACRAVIEDAIRVVGPPPTGAPVNQFPITVPAPPSKPAIPIGGVVRLQWVGAGLYGTDQARRTRYALSPAAAGYFTRHLGVHGRPGAPAPSWWDDAAKVPQNELLGNVPSWWRPGHPLYRRHPGPRVY